VLLVANRSVYIPLQSFVCACAFTSLFVGASYLLRKHGAHTFNPSNAYMYLCITWHNSDFNKKYLVCTLIGSPVARLHPLTRLVRVTASQFTIGPSTQVPQLNSSTSAFPLSSITTSGFQSVNPG
jgi:hypothetical protein